jgi:hypothetical protein
MAKKKQSLLRPHLNLIKEQYKILFSLATLAILAVIVSRVEKTVDNRFIERILILYLEFKQDQPF